MLLSSPIDRSPASRVPNPAQQSDPGTLTPEKKQELEKLKTACKDFESIFSFQLMKEMRKTVQKGKFVHGGMAEEIFSDMLDQERSKGVALGIGDILFQQLSKSIVPTRRRP